MRAHYLQHVPFENPGSIRLWLESAGYEIAGTAFYESVILPDVRDIDFLVVMGGPMSVNDEMEFPWLVPEKKFIHDAVKAGKAVLGVCLGAQLIAAAMGSRVYRNREKEIGWFPVHGIKTPGSRSFEFPQSIEVFHWHGETFDLPEGAIRIAESGACRNQAFQIGSSVVGLQFHLEMTPESVQMITDNCRSELVQAKYIQPEEVILGASNERYLETNRVMGELLSYLGKQKGK